MQVAPLEKVRPGAFLFVGNDSGCLIYSKKCEK